MSYILNALKKAERDRLREDPADLDDLVSPKWDPYQQRAGSNGWRYAAVVTVVALLLLAVNLYINPPWSQPPSVPQAVKPELQVPVPQPVADKAPLDPVPQLSPPPESVAGIPQLAITGHMFFTEGSASNRLFANNLSYREGDSIEGDWMLVKIGAEGFEIRSGERSVKLLYP